MTTNRLNRERRSNSDSWKAELVKVEKQIRGIIEAIKEGMYQPSMKAEMDALEDRKKQLTEFLTDVPEDAPDLLPSASAIYARKVAILTKALNRPNERQQAAEALRDANREDRADAGAETGRDSCHAARRTADHSRMDRAPSRWKGYKNNTPGARLTGVSVSVVAGTRSRQPHRLAPPVISLKL
jgi:hypothetical protein